MSLIQQALDKNASKTAGSKPKAPLAAAAVPQANPALKPRRELPKIKPPASLVYPLKASKHFDPLAHKQSLRPHRNPRAVLYKAAGVLLLLCLVMMVGYLLLLEVIQSRNQAADILPAASKELSPPVASRPNPISAPAPDEQVSAVNTRFLLSGITTTGGEKFALINNRILQTGSRVDSDTVVKEISGRSVVLESSGKEIRLTLSS